MKSALYVMLCLLALSLVTLSTAARSANAESQEAAKAKCKTCEGESVLRHLVLLKFKDEATGEQIEKIEKGLEELPEKIDAIVDFEWGKDVSVEGKAKGFTHAALVTFADADGRAEYLPHPAHKAFVEILKPALDKVLVVDYFTHDVQRDTKQLESARSVLRHAVLFKFREGTPAKTVRKIEKSFARLPKKVDAIAAFEWGVNNSPEGLDDGFTHAFLVTFAGAEGRTAYLPHAAHKRFVELVGPHLEDVLVFDYSAQR